jgi:hypothetical protein
MKKGDLLGIGLGRIFIIRGTRFWHFGFYVVGPWDDTHQWRRLVNKESLKKESLIHLVGQCHQGLLESVSVCRMRWHCGCDGVVLITGNHVFRNLTNKKDSAICVDCSGCCITRLLVAVNTSPILWLQPNLLWQYTVVLRWLFQDRLLCIIGGYIQMSIWEI